MTMTKNNDQVSGASGDTDRVGKTVRETVDEMVDAGVVDDRLGRVAGVCS